jgi:hypothetical protein
VTTASQQPEERAKSLIAAAEHEVIVASEFFERPLAQLGVSYVDVLSEDLPRRAAREFAKVCKAAVDSKNVTQVHWDLYAQGLRLVRTLETASIVPNRIHAVDFGRQLCEALQPLMRMWLLQCSTTLAAWVDVLDAADLRVPELVSDKLYSQLSMDMFTALDAVLFSLQTIPMGQVDGEHVVLELMRTYISEIVGSTCLRFARRRLGLFRTMLSECKQVSSDVRSVLACGCSLVNDLTQVGVQLRGLGAHIRKLVVKLVSGPSGTATGDQLGASTQLCAERLENKVQLACEMLGTACFLPASWHLLKQWPAPALPHIDLGDLESVEAALDATSEGVVVDEVMRIVSKTVSFCAVQLYEASVPMLVRALARYIAGQGWKLARTSRVSLRADDAERLVMRVAALVSMLRSSIWPLAADVEDEVVSMEPLVALAQSQTDAVVKSYVEVRHLLTPLGKVWV